jgi:hypothetical protein
VNISEANACSTLLRYAAGVSQPGIGPVSLDRAVVAGAFLAGRVRKALDAGPDPDDIATGLAAKATATSAGGQTPADVGRGDPGDGRGWSGPGLPTFEDIRAHAYAVLGDAADWLRSDWRPGTGPTAAAADAVTDARAAISAAKTALNRAAAAMDRR